MHLILKLFFKFVKKLIILHTAFCYTYLYAFFHLLFFLFAFFSLLFSIIIFFNCLFFITPQLNCWLYIVSDFTRTIIVSVFQEIALDVFLHVYWEDPRIRILGNASQVELTWDKDPKFWIPDLYIRQLREMKVLTLFQDLASIRLYDNSTLRISIG